MKKTFFLFHIMLLVPFLNLSQDLKEKENLMLGFFERGYEQIYVQKDSAMANLEKAFKIASEIGDYDSSLGILDHIIITADYHTDLPKYRSSLLRKESILLIEGIGQSIENYEGWKISYTLGLASYHFETQEYAKAKEFFLKTLAYFDGIPPQDLSANQANRLYTTYSSLGTTYMYLGKYELSEINFQRSLALVNNAPILAVSRDSYINGTQQSLAQLYTRTAKHKEATQFYLKNLEWAQSHYQKDKMFKNNLVNAFQKITLSYIAQDSLQKALTTLNESMPYLPENDPFHKDALMLYGDIYLGLNEKEKALTSYEKALAVFAQYSRNITHRDIAEIHGKIAGYYLKQGDFAEGLKNIQKAFTVSGTNVQLTHNNDNPDANEVFSRTQLLELLNIKLQLLQLAFEDTKNNNYKKVLLKTSNDILTTFDILKGEFDSKLDKTFLVDKAYPIFHRMLNVAYMSYEENPNLETLQLALNIAEKNKDFLLMEALRSSQAHAYGDVPQELLEKETQLRAEITHLEKGIFDATETDSGFSEELFNLKQEYYNFLDTVKVKFPKYHDLKYQSRTLDMGMIRNKVMQDNETLVSFTMTPDYLYAIILNGSDEKFLKLPFSDQDRKMTRDFYQLISSPSISRTDNTFSGLGNALYAKILKKPLEEFDCEKLIIIADDVLHYLPFDLLQNKGDYLLKTHAISYGNSINTLIELKEKQRSKTNGVLAFAPNFNNKPVVNEEREFGQLLYNDDEVTKISTYFNTKIFSDEQATLKNFKAMSRESGIIHLATHASANDQFPDYSYLAFSEEEDDHILYIKDLYNTSLNADLVVLSACQTGIGKLQEGQGMLSLSKGFYYAGAKSLVNTLWKINDKSTVKLMDYLYEALSEGKSKTEALRYAKLKYLETTDDELLKHPYYWAGFVVSGNIDPIANPISKWWWILFTVSIIAAVWYVKKKKSVKGL